MGRLPFLLTSSNPLVLRARALEGSLTIIPHYIWCSKVCLLDE